MAAVKLEMMRMLVNIHTMPTILPPTLRGTLSP